MPKNSSIRLNTLVELRLMTSRQTQAAIADAALAQRRAVKLTLYFAKPRS